MGKIETNVDNFTENRYDYKLQKAKENMLDDKTYLENLKIRLLNEPNNQSSLKESVIYADKSLKASTYLYEDMQKQLSEGNWYIQPSDKLINENLNKLIVKETREWLKGLLNNILKGKDTENTPSALLEKDEKKGSEELNNYMKEEWYIPPSDEPEDETPPKNPSKNEEDKEKYVV